MVVVVNGVAVEDVDKFADGALDDVMMLKISVVVAVAIIVVVVVSMFGISVIDVVSGEVVLEVVLVVSMLGISVVDVSCVPLITVCIQSMLAVTLANTSGYPNPKQTQSPLVTPTTVYWPFSWTIRGPPLSLKQRCLTWLEPAHKCIL